MDGDVRDILKQIHAPQEKKERTHGALSRRAQKRQEKQATIKAQREKQKRLKAKAIARKQTKAAGATALPEPKPRSAKFSKQRMEDHGDSEAEEAKTSTKPSSPATKPQRTSHMKDKPSARVTKTSMSEAKGPQDLQSGMKRKRRRKDA